MAQGFENLRVRDYLSWAPIRERCYRVKELLWAQFLALLFGLGFSLPPAMGLVKVNLKFLLVWALEAFAVLKQFGSQAESRVVLRFDERWTDSL